MKINNPVKWLQRILCASWVVIFLFFVFLSFVKPYLDSSQQWQQVNDFCQPNSLCAWLNLDHKQVQNAQNQRGKVNSAANQNSQETATQEKEQGDKATEDSKDKLKVYGQYDDEFKLWSRDEAIRFGFDKAAGTISYLFVAASVMLGLIGKFMIDPLLDPTKVKLLQSRTVLILLQHAALGCLISICYGFFAYLYFASIADADEFTIYNQIGIAIFCQLISFVLAALLLMFAVNKVVTEHLNPKR